MRLAPSWTSQQFLDELRYVVATALNSDIPLTWPNYHHAQDSIEINEIARHPIIRLLELLRLFDGSDLCMDSINSGNLRWVPEVALMIRWDGASIVELESSCPGQLA